MHNGCEGRTRMLKWDMGRHAFNFVLANGRLLWSVLPRGLKKHRSAGRQRHRFGFSFRSAGLCTNIPVCGHSPPSAKIREPICCFQNEPSRIISRRNFFSQSGLTGAALLTGTAFAGSLDAMVDFYITDTAHEPLEDAHIRAVHHSNPALEYNIDTDENGYAKLDLATAVRGRNSLPEGYELNQNFPNPFNPSTNIQFSLPKPEHVNITIYNSLGQFVTELSNEMFGEGAHTLQWNGYGADNRPVANGAYFAHFKTDNWAKTIRMMKVGEQRAGARMGSLRKILAEGDLYDFYVTKDGYDTLTNSEFILGGERFDWQMEKANEAPHALYNIPEKGYVDEPVQFTNLSVDNDGSVVESAYEFGDGETVKLDGTESTEHTYTTAGKYTTKLTVKDNRGATASLEKEIDVGVKLKLDLEDVVNEEAINTPTTIKLTNGTNTYEFTTNDGKLEEPIYPGKYTIEITNETMHSPFIVKLADGQSARSMPRAPIAELDLTNGGEGKGYMINNSFDKDIYGRVWDLTNKGPPGVELWAPPEDGSDPTGTTTLQAMGYGDGIAIGPKIKNYYIYLGEDADHKLEAPFTYANLRQMTDEIKQTIEEFILSEEMESFRQAGLEPGEKYQVNIHFGRDPPLRYVQLPNGTTGKTAKVGWHIIMPYNSNLHNEEVGPDNNRTYSAISFLNIPVFDGGANMKAEISQPDGPRSDIDIADYSKDITFFNTQGGKEEFQPYDYVAQRISNVFREGFSFK